MKNTNIAIARALCARIYEKHTNIAIARVLCPSIYGKRSYAIVGNSYGGVPPAAVIAFSFSKTQADTDAVPYTPSACPDSTGSNARSIP